MIKKILLTILISVSSLTYGQDSYETFDQPNKKVEINKTSIKVVSKRSVSSVTPSIGLGMMYGGGAFVVAGLLTPPIYVGGSTTEKKPFYSQPRFYPMVSGGLIFMVGAVISLGN